MASAGAWPTNAPKDEDSRDQKLVRATLGVESCNDISWPPIPFGTELDRPTARGGRTLTERERLGYLTELLAQVLPLGFQTLCSDASRYGGKCKEEKGMISAFV